MAPPIRVAYDIATKVWTIAPMVHKMNAAGAIVFLRDPQNQAWKFDSVSLPADWTQSTAGNGGQIMVNDPFNQVGAFPYRIKITLDAGGTVISPEFVLAGDPPIIMNE